jgi:hypothetical protein
MMTYKEFMTEVVKMSILYWPEILMQKLVLSQLIRSLDQGANRPSMVTEEA